MICSFDLCGMWAASQRKPFPCVMNRWLLSDAFSSREPVSTSLENAIDSGCISGWPGTRHLFEGFYKVRFQLGQTVGAESCLCATAKCWAAIRPSPISAATRRPGDEFAVEIKTVRHNPDPNYRRDGRVPTMATSIATARPDGELYRFEGRAEGIARRQFQSVMTPIEEERFRSGRGRRGRHRQWPLPHPHPDARRR